MPAINKLHIDKLLSEISVKYSNVEYIADRVFPTLNVNKDHDYYRVYVRNWRIPETARANRAVAREKDWDVTQNSYLLEKHALKGYVSDDDVQNYDAASYMADTTEDLTDAIMRRMEKKVADLFTTTGWSLNVSLAAANTFNTNTTVSNPIIYFDTGATEIIGSSGVKPNYAIVPRTSYVACKQHVSILDRIKYTSSEISEKILAALFDVGELLVPSASYDSSAEGVTDSIEFIWAQDICFLGFKPPRPSPLKPSAGYIFKKNKPLVKRWRVEERESEAIEVNIAFVPKIVASLAGFLIKDTLA